MSLLFDGTDDSASVASTPVTAVAFTIGGWVKRGAINATQSIMQLDDGTATNLFRMACQSTNIARLITTATTPQQADSAATITDTTDWHYLMGVYAGVADRTVYVDSNAGVQNTGSRTPTGIANIRFGLIADSTLDFNGRLAHWAIWSTGLTSGNRDSLVAGANPYAIARANLVAYWPMTEPSTAGRDVVGSYSLTLNGNTAYSSDNPAVADYRRKNLLLGVG